MLKIFAKKGTNEKALVACGREQVGIVMSNLNTKLGGDWIFVDKVNPGEILLFEDNMTYRGFDGVSERYSSGIRKL